MKKITIYILIISLYASFSMCGIADRKYKVVSYGGVTVEAPMTWKINKEEGDGVYYIEMEPRAADNIVIVTVFNDFMDWEELMNDYQASFRKTMPQNRRAISYSDVEEKEFNGMDSYECNFGGAHTLLIYGGRIIIFDDEERTYSLLITGSESFMDSDQLKYILNSFKIEK